VNEARIAGPCVRVLSPDAGQELELVRGPGSAQAIVGPHIGARRRSMWRIALEPGARTVTLGHSGEAVFYVESGAGELVTAADGRRPVGDGSVVLVDPSTEYRFEAGRSRLCLLGGPAPSEPFPREDGAIEAWGDGRAHLFHRDEPSGRVPMIASDARLIVWPGVGARSATMNWVRLNPGEENKPHAHASSEDTIVILAGRGTIDDLTHERTLEFEAGDVVFVDPGVEHRVRANRGVEIESVGGPCPPDHAMLQFAEPV
jgi:mannose-6-phosphate isomerase-like protein (cupin superfamily)